MKRKPCFPKKKQKLIARSPEAFPKLSIYPDGWDLEKMITRPKKAKSWRPKQKDKMRTFPDTTNAIL